MKYTLTFILLLCFGLSVSAQDSGCIYGDCYNGYGKYEWSNGDFYIGNWKNGKQDGQGSYTFKNGGKYFGEYKDGARHGSGTYTWIDGEKYSGQWMSDKQHGEGTHYYTNGTTKAGIWKEGQYQGTITSVTGCIFGDCDNGYGTYVWSTGEKYTGNWSNKKRKGQGDNYFASGEKYSGEWLNDKRHGYGTNTYLDGTEKTGMWEYDRYVGSGSNNYGCISGNCDNGYGVYTWQSGERYEGYWKNKKRNGQGTNYFSTGAYYEGEFKDDKKHGVGFYKYIETSPYESYYGDYNMGKLDGFGTLKWKNGRQYVGEIKNNLFHGQGTMHYADGTVKSGKWENDKFVGSTETKTGCISGNCQNGFGTYISETGNRYTGEFYNGRYHGQGKYTFAAGDEYKGEFQNGAYNGNGTYLFSNGNKYVGEFKNSTYHGIGTLFYANGTTKSGKWENGTFIGEEEDISVPPKIEWLTPSVSNSESTENEVSVKICIKTKSELENVQFYVNDVVKVNYATRGYSVVSSGCDYIIERKVPLTEGENRIRAKVTATSGEAFSDTRIINRKTKSIALKEKRYALVIGNSNYPTAPLKNPANDARAISQKLKSLGFEVAEHTNLSRNDMIREIRAFGNKLAAEKGVGLFYFAGHGLQLQGENYLVPVNARIEKQQDVELESVNLRRIMGEMEYASNEMNIVILDACRNNPFERSFRSGGGNGLASTTAPQGTFIAFATAPGSVASDGSGDNGLYTQELIKIMGEPGLPIEDVFKKVRVNVYQMSDKKQVPWENSSIFRDFYFIP
jgi:hypothetical protein